MSDRDDLGHAWHTSPTDYLKKRPATHMIGAPVSRYVTMRDGVRLAVDVYLPAGTDPAQRVPAIALKHGDQGGVLIAFAAGIAVLPQPVRGDK